MWNTGDSYWAIAPIRVGRFSVLEKNVAVLTERILLTGQED